MKKNQLYVHEKKLVGITIRTNNADEMTNEKAKISSTLSYYFENNLPEKILYRVNPGTTYCAYTEFESDENGEYTYFVGEEVSSFEKLDPIFKKLIIPAGLYTKFSVGPGKMPHICIDAWKSIWKMHEADFGGKRAYLTDFEIYGERALNPENASLDIYIGLKL